MFSRFLRGIVRSPILSTHSLVVEFLGTDHYNEFKVNGLNEFNKKLTDLEAKLQKDKTCLNQIFRITSTRDKLSLVEGKDKRIKMDEKTFVNKYD
jgi:fatty acid/phospholipid biosynthesis enzyme